MDVCRPGSACYSARDLAELDIAVVTMGGVLDVGFWALRVLLDAELHWHTANSTNLGISY